MTNSHDGEYLSAMASPLSPVLVSRLAVEGPDAWTVSWPRAFDFQPGQVVALGLTADGPQRLYSLSSGNRDDEASVLFNLAPEGWLTPQLARLRTGDTLYVSAPFGSFLGAPGAGSWVANGTGVAPYLSMARSGLGAGKRLVHGARTKESFYGQEVLKELLGDAYVRCASADSGEGLVPGRLTAYLETSDLKGPVYLCGSASMIVDARDILIRRGHAFHTILSEVYF